MSFEVSCEKDTIQIIYEKCTICRRIVDKYIFILFIFIKKVLDLINILVIIDRIIWIC